MKLGRAHLAEMFFKLLANLLILSAKSDSYLLPTVR